MGSRYDTILALSCTDISALTKAWDEMTAETPTIEEVILFSALIL